MSFLGLWFRMNRCFVIRWVYVTKFYKERGQINIKVKSSFENDTVVHNKNWLYGQVHLTEYNKQVWIPVRDSDRTQEHTFLPISTPMTIETIQADIVAA